RQPLQPGVCRELPGESALARDGPEVAAVDEGDCILGQGGEAKQTRIGGRGYLGATGGRRRGQRGRQGNGRARDGAPEAPEGYTGSEGIRGFGGQVNRHAWAPEARSSLRGSGDPPNQYAVWNTTVPVKRPPSSAAAAVGHTLAQRPRRRQA